jgi:hypothetical protein
VKAAEKTLSSSTMLVEPITELIDKLDRIDFQTRLEKLDTSVSALHTGLQNTQSRIDGLERNIKDELNDLEKDIERFSKDTLTNLDKQSERIGKKSTFVLVVVLVNTIILACLVGLSLLT